MIDFELFWIWCEVRSKAFCLFCMWISNCSSLFFQKDYPFANELLVFACILVCGSELLDSLIHSTDQFVYTSTTSTWLLKTGSVRLEFFFKVVLVISSHWTFHMNFRTKLLVSMLKRKAAGALTGTVLNPSLTTGTLTVWTLHLPLFRFSYFS